MKTLIYTSLLLCCLSNPLMAQKYFEKNIVFYNYFQTPRQIVSTNDGYAIRGGAKQDPSDTWEAFFIKTNDQLDTLFSKKIAGQTH